jgi:hypothetical protein
MLRKEHGGPTKSLRMKRRISIADSSSEYASITKQNNWAEALRNPMDTAADGRVTWNGIKCFRINDRKKLSKKQASARWKDKVPSPTG